MKKKIKKKLEARKQAPNKIREFFGKAEEAFPKNQKLADDYVRKARNLAMRFRIRLPKALKRRFCRHCYSYLKPGVNCRVRTRDRKAVYYCLNCKKYMRFAADKKKK